MLNGHPFKGLSLLGSPALFLDCIGSTKVCGSRCCCLQLTIIDHHVLVFQMLLEFAGCRGGFLGGAQIWRLDTTLALPSTRCLTCVFITCRRVWLLIDNNRIFERHTSVFLRLKLYQLCLLHMTTDNGVPGAIGISLLRTSCSLIFTLIGCFKDNAWLRAHICVLPLGMNHRHRVGGWWVEATLSRL